MYKNAEGYRDETACRAIIAVAREERIKRRKLQEDKNMERENKTGEVWRTRTVTGTEKIVLVVADHGAMAYVIHLAEEGVHTDIEVNCEGLRYGSSDRMYYVPSRSFEEYLRTVTDEQLADVKNKLAAAIGIEPQIVEKRSCPGSTGGNSEQYRSCGATKMLCCRGAGAYDPCGKSRSTAGRVQRAV